MIELNELKRRVSAGFANVSQEIVGECIELARNTSPSACDARVRRVAVRAGLDQRSELGLVKSTRALAMIRRDYGEEEFWNKVGTLTGAGKPKRVLWMSRHPVHEGRQMEALHRMFGADVEVEQDPNSFDNAGVIALRYERGGYDDLVVVAPLSVLDHLCRQGLKPLWSEAVEENDPAKIEFRGARGQGYRFVRFRRVKRVALEFEDE